MIQAMVQPFQCLYKFPKKDEGKYDVLAAASGSCILFFDIASENLMSVWTLQRDQENLFKEAVDVDDQNSEDAISNEFPSGESTRASKRQKVSCLEGGSETSIGPLSADDRDFIANPSTVSQLSSAIIKLTGTRNGRYLIAVTDDKSIRVLEVLNDNSVKQLSER